ncbi:MAG: AAA family ATPase [Chitinophagales bacterium]
MYNFDIFQGKGRKSPFEFPTYEHLNKLDEPSGYIASDYLKDAVNVALALGQPLLLTGEPGTGKTHLAKSLAWELGLGEPLVFNAKTDSSAKDLFYRYDSLGHFHHTQIKKTEIGVSDYIHFEALGKAILATYTDANVRALLPKDLQQKEAQKSVVLIDEVDKATRDFPNNILHEIENMSFTVTETGEKYGIEDQRYRPIIILTSNSEKNLPDAFLRRCVYYHIPFPDRVMLQKIVNTRLQLSDAFKERMLEAALNHFEEIRAKNLRKKPATAELLAWIHILNKLEVNMNVPTPEELMKLASSYSILAKNPEDLKRLREDL